MSLPFLNPQKVGSILMARRAKKADGGMVDVQNEMNEPHPGVMSAAEDLIGAIHAKNGKAVAEALMEAFGILDSDSDEGSEVDEA